MGLSLVDEKTISYFPAFVNYNRDLYNLQTVDFNNNDILDMFKN
ncbi:MAG: hypothetical protein ACK52J_01640 [bacterium]|jgi:hypothetical protein